MVNILITEEDIYFHVLGVKILHFAEHVQNYIKIRRETKIKIEKKEKIWV